MFSIRKWFFPDSSALKYRGEVRQGKRGRWRWSLRAPNGRLVAQSSIHGEESALAAKEALLQLISHRISIIDWEIEAPIKTPEVGAGQEP